MLIKPFRSIESAATATHNWRRRQILRAGASTLVLGLVAPRLALASSVLGVRVWPARDYTRVTIESDQPLQNAQQLLQGPDRLVVDLSGLDLDQALKDLVSKITPNDPQIQSVRVGQFQPHVVRMVFDLKGSVKPQVFTLPPVGAYKYRLVFDLYPAVAPDPLMELLAQSERKQQTLNEENSAPPATLSGPGTTPPAADNSEAFFERYAQNGGSGSAAGAPHAPAHSGSPSGSTSGSPGLPPIIAKTPTPTPGVPPTPATPPTAIARNKGSGANSAKSLDNDDSGDDTYAFTTPKSGKSITRSLRHQRIKPFLATRNRHQSETGHYAYP